MDRISPRADIEAAGREMGIILGDLAHAFVQAMQRQADELERAGEELWRMLAEVRQPAATMADQQVEVIARRFAQAGHVQVVGIVRNEFRRTWGLLLAGVVAAILLGFSGGWLWGRGPTLTCGDYQGGRLCWVWTTPPTETGRVAPDRGAEARQAKQPNLQAAEFTTPQRFEKRR
jgi:hypothetical protein